MFEISASCSPCGGLVVVLAMEGLLRPTTSAAFGTGALTPIAALAETRRHAQPRLATHRLWAGLEGKEPSPPTTESLLVHPQIRGRLHDARTIPAGWAGAPGARCCMHGNGALTLEDEE